jgi:sugar O-acyltransferase (sialic acid O-acetyltransferase NeuD family)
MRKVVFWGATGQSKVLFEAISGTDIQLVALIDNRNILSPFPGIPVLLGINDFQRWMSERNGISDLYYVIAVGGGKGKDRIELMQSLEGMGLKPLTIIHPAAFVAKDAIIGAGCQILAQSAVCAESRLGRSVIINTAASVDHNTVIGDGSHIAPGAHIAGEVVVERGVFIGMGAVVLPRINIGEYATVGAGAVVIKDVPAGKTVIGNPAKIIRKTNGPKQTVSARSRK